MEEGFLEINLFGPCLVRKPGPDGYEIKSTKHKALFAILATAPFGRRTRSFLQDALWGQYTFDSGRRSLRRAISDIKNILGPDFDRFLTSAHSEITLNLSQVRFTGRPGSGVFLEGLDIREEGFEEWLRNIRSNPSQIYGLFSAAHQPPPPAILPTVAVIPFHLVTGDPQMAVAGDWLAEEVCRSLSKSNLMSVISHLSARQLDYAAIDVRSMRAALGADYFLVGSLRIAPDRCVLNTDFLDAETGRILWTREFNSPLSDLLSAHSEPIATLTTAIARKIASDSLCRVRGRNLVDIEDHRLLLAGVSMLHELRLSSFARARQMIEHAIERAPHAPEPLAWLGDWYLMSIWNGYSTDIRKDTQIATECAYRALDLEPENSLSLAVVGVIQSALKRNQGLAAKQFARALDCNPNDSMSWLFSGAMHAYHDKGRQAVENVERAKSLSPLDPLGYLFNSLAAYAYVADESYERAVELADVSLEQNAWHISTLRTKICAHHHLGQGQKVRETGALLRQRFPKFELEEYRGTHPASDFNVGHRMVDALRAAGF